MANYEVVRTATIDASVERVKALIDDFHEWKRWSPWEQVDPDLQRTFSGAESGVGAVYEWSGNRKAGPMTFATRVMSIFKKMDDLIGPDFERGLAQLRTAATA